MSHFEFEQALSNVKNIYISNEEFWQVNTQSCDFVKLIIDTGEKMISVCHREFGEDGAIELDEVCEYSKGEYNYKVLMHDENFKVVKIKYFDNGLIDAIKFKYNDVFLFIFALDDTLVLTKSKYDLLDASVIDFPEEEATLEIIYNL